MTMDCKEFEIIVKKVLKREPDERDAILTADDVKALCHAEENGYKTRDTIFGYPSHPLYREISNMLKIWMDTKCCPVLDLPSYHLLDEKHYVESRAATVASLTPMLEGLKSLWSFWTEEEKAYRIRDILKTLGKRGILDLLGVRRTVGSADMWPVNRKTLEKTFCEKHGADANTIFKSMVNVSIYTETWSGSDLSVGARALAKHHHRDMSESWWGKSTGNEKARNEHALSMMNKILDIASWINIHCLPHDVKILEIRQPEGYGVRWTAEGSSFRGFVEPQMVDGHAVGWRH